MFGTSTTAIAKPHAAPTESFKTISIPRHSGAQKLLVFWNTRPSDGIMLGRDVPSRAIAPLLGDVTIWQTVGGGEDYIVHHMGEAVRARFGGYVVGERMSALLPPDVLGYHQELNRRLLIRDDIGLFEVMLHEGPVVTRR